MQTLVAAFEDQTTAERAVEALIANGFSRQAVHLQSGYSGASSAAGSTSMSSSSASSSTSPTNDGFIAGVEHFFANLFGDQEDTTGSHAGSYTHAVRQGRSIVVVDAMSDEQVDDATAMLNELGAIDVDEQSGSTGSATAGTGMSTGAATGTASLGVASQSGSEHLSDAGQAVLPVVAEELQVGKRMVDRGGIRVIKRVTEVPVSEMVRLREERAVVERRPVDRAASEADLAEFKEGTIEVREQGEEAVVGKTARVVEEVVVGKQVTEREQNVSDTVRRTDVEVETIGTESRSTSTHADSVQSNDVPGSAVR